MIWYKSRVNNQLSNLSKAVAFEIVPVGSDFRDIMAIIPAGKELKKYSVETFFGNYAQARAEAFIRWLSTIITDSENINFVYDDSCFLQFARDEEVTE